MEKKTFMRKPLDELIGLHFWDLRVTKEQLLTKWNTINPTNHRKKEFLWYIYLKRKETRLP